MQDTEVNTKTFCSADMKRRSTYNERKRRKVECIPSKELEQICEEKSYSCPEFVFNSGMGTVRCDIYRDNECSVINRLSLLRYGPSPEETKEMVAAACLIEIKTKPFKKALVMNQGNGNKTQTPQCRYGSGCIKQHAVPPCPFLHPNQNKGRPPHCRYGAGCMKQHAKFPCPFLHPNQNQARLPYCRYGAGCMKQHAKPSCPFLHPNQNQVSEMECFRIIAEKITAGASKQKSPISIINEILQKLPSVLDKKPSWYITEDGDGKFRGTFKLVHLDQRIFCESHCLVGDKGDAKRKAANEMLRILMHRAQEIGQGKVKVDRGKSTSKMECFRIIAEKITERASKQKSPISIINEILQKLPSVLDKKPSWYITEDGDGKFRGTFKLVHLDQRIFCESHCLVGDKGDAKRKAANEMLRILMHRAQEIGVYAPEIKEIAAVEQQSSDMKSEKLAENDSSIIKRLKSIRSILKKTKVVKHFRVRFGRNTTHILYPYKESATENLHNFCIKKGYSLPSYVPIPQMGAVRCDIYRDSHRSRKGHLSLTRKGPSLEAAKELVAEACLVEIRTNPFVAKAPCRVEEGNDEETDGEATPLLPEEADDV